MSSVELELIAVRAARAADVVGLTEEIRSLRAQCADLEEQVRVCGVRCCVLRCVAEFFSLLYCAAVYMWLYTHMYIYLYEC